MPQQDDLQHGERLVASRYFDLDWQSTTASVKGNVKTTIRSDDDETIYLAD